MASDAPSWHGTAVAWKIVEIETSAPGWRTQGGAGLDPTAEGTGGPGGRMMDVNHLIDEVADAEGGYTYRAPLS